MINALIFATIALAFVCFPAAFIAIVAFFTIYFAAIFIHHSMASICRRHRAAISQTVSETIEAIATVTEEITPVIKLPNSIRGLRQFVREHSLQDAIKGITGKSVSKLNKGELMAAIEMALA